MKQQNQAIEGANPKSGAAKTPDDSSSKATAEYSIKRRETLAEAPGLRVRLLTLLEGQNVPWHYHNHITDTLLLQTRPNADSDALA